MLASLKSLLSESRASRHYHLRRDGTRLTEGRDREMPRPRRIDYRCWTLGFGRPRREEGKKHDAEERPVSPQAAVSGEGRGGGGGLADASNPSFRVGRGHTGQGWGD